MLSAGLTLAEVSRRCGIDQPALSRLENGHNKNPTLDTLWRYAAAVGQAPGPDHRSHPRHATGAGQEEASPCGTREVEARLLRERDSAPEPGSGALHCNHGL